MAPFVFTQKAIEDIIFQAYYHEQIQAGPGDRFARHVYDAAEEISILPEGYESRYKNTRGKKRKKFSS